jgi:magnesium transporter
MTGGSSVMIEQVQDELLTELRTLIRERRFHDVRAQLLTLSAPDLAEVIASLEDDYEAVAFRLLPRTVSVTVFEHLPVEAQQSVLHSLADSDAAAILDDMSPDDRTALLEELPGKVTRRLLNLLSPDQLSVATQLLGYPAESIGRLMSPKYVAVKPEWTVTEALAHIRLYGSDSETLNVVYVVAKGGRLIADIRMRELLLVPPETTIRMLMRDQVVALSVFDDQESAVSIFRRYDRTALPVVDTEGIIIGVVTVDDVLDVAEQEATEDVQKMAGSRALEEPYLKIGFLDLIRKRSVWLVVLFFGQMLTATAMGRYEAELSQALVLALFVPLIISSGGNSGSQAAALIIRALTLGEVRLRDWWRVLRREAASGLVIGLVLGILGFTRVAIVQAVNGSYGPAWFQVGVTIMLSLVGVVLWGMIMGALLPFVLERFGLDPATSSTPMVATLVDVTGIIIYFSIATVVLRGTLL